MIIWYEMHATLWQFDISIEAMAHGQFDDVVSLRCDSPGFGTSPWNGNREHQV